jgi:CRP-like cAMP-binding protein
MCEFIEKAGWLSTLPTELRSMLLRKSQLRSLAKNERVFHAGDPPGGLVGLVKGSLAVEVMAGYRSQQKSYLFHPGTWTGEGTIGVLESRMIGLWATRPSDVILVSRPVFLQTAVVHTELWRHLLTMSTENNLRAVRMADALMERNNRRRIALVLLLLGGQFDAYRPAHPLLDIDQNELAAIVNLSRSALSPIIREFEKAGEVRIGRGAIELINCDSLKSIASSD